MVTGSWKEGGRLAVCESTGGSVDSPQRAHPLILSIASTHCSSTRALPPHTVCDNLFPFCNNLRRRIWLWGFLIEKNPNLLSHCSSPPSIDHLRRMRLCVNIILMYVQKNLLTLNYFICLVIENTWEHPLYCSTGLPPPLGQAQQPAWTWESSHWQMSFSILKVSQ